MPTRYDAYPDHPLCGVPQEILDAAREVMAGAVEWKDVDPNMADPLADAVVAALRPWLNLPEQSVRTVIPTGLPHLAPVREDEVWSYYDGKQAGTLYHDERLLYYDIVGTEWDDLYPEGEPRQFLVYTEWDENTMKPLGEPVGWCDETDFEA